MIYLYLMLMLFFLSGSKGKTKSARTLGLVCMVVFSIVFGGYALGSELARSDNAAGDICRP